MEKDNLEQILKTFGFSRSETNHNDYDCYESSNHRLEYFVDEALNIEQFTLYKIDEVFSPYWAFTDILTAHVPNSEKDFKTILEIYLSL